MKTCTKCKVEKPKSGFHRHSYSRDGYKSACKACLKDVAKVYNANNKARISAYYKVYREAHKDDIAAYQKEYGERHKEALSEYKRERNKVKRDEIARKDRARYEANKIVVAARHKAWKASNPEKVRVNHHRRRSRTLAAEGHFTAEDILALFEKQSGCCVYCRNDISLKYHIDHILALVLGGTNWPSNLQLLCPSYNTSKGKKTHEEFIAYRVLLGLYVPPEFLLI